MCLAICEYELYTIKQTRATVEAQDAFPTDLHGDGFAHTDEESTVVCLVD